MKVRIGIFVVIFAFAWGGSASAQFGGFKSLAKKAAEKAEKKKEAPAPQARPAEQPARPAGRSNAGPQPTVGGEPNLVAAKIDFIPGEKTVFSDDFSDMPPGEPPPHWRVRDGHVDLLMGGGVRALSIPAGVNLTTGSLQIPSDFTMQVVFVPKAGFNDASGFLGFEFRNKDDDNVLSGQINVKYNSVSLDNDLGSVSTTYEADKPNEFDLWAQQGRLRVYLNGNRLIDVNQVHPGPIDHLYVDESQGTFELRSVRIAESAPDPGDVLATTGKFVTHGILFDTDSDILEAGVGAGDQGNLHRVVQAPGVEGRDRRLHGFDRRCGPQPRSLQAAGRGGDEGARGPVRHRPEPAHLEWVRSGASDRVQRHGRRPAENRRVEFVKVPGK